jgi:cyclohexyl-isocyanide hydratase
MAIKRIAFLVFPRLTLLDLVGAYDALRRIATMKIDPGVTHRIIGTEAEIVDETGLVIKPDSVYEDLVAFDLLYVPGGFGTRALLDDSRVASSLDLGLYLVEKFWGAGARETIAAQMEYRAYSPV